MCIHGNLYFCGKYTLYILYTFKYEEMLFIIIMIFSTYFLRPRSCLKAIIQASISAAGFANIPLSTITTSAGWSNADTFAKFYNKPVIANEQNFGKELLQSFQTTNAETLLD